MAVDSFMTFQDYAGNWLPSESQVSCDNSKSDEIGKPITTAPAGSVFEVDNFSFDIKQTINMSSQSSGAGAGKVNFNPFKISRKIDKASPTLFNMACKGTTFKFVRLGFRKAAGVDATGLFFLRFDFKLVAIKTINWAHGDDSPTEDVEMQFGGLQIQYGVQQAGGSITKQNLIGWNSIKNIADITADPIGTA